MLASHFAVDCYTDIIRYYKSFAEMLISHLTLVLHCEGCQFVRHVKNFLLLLHTVSSMVQNIKGNNSLVAILDLCKFHIVALVIFSPLLVCYSWLRDYFSKWHFCCSFFNLESLSVLKCLDCTCIMIQCSLYKGLLNEKYSLSKNCLSITSTVLLKVLAWIFSPYTVLLSIMSCPKILNAICNFILCKVSET